MILVPEKKIKLEFLPSNFRQLNLIIFKKFSKEKA